jgi:hypothetical protein
VSYPKESIDLTIAGLGVHLVCNDTKVVAALRDEYHPYLGANLPRLQVNVNRKRQPGDRKLLEAKGGFRQGVLHFNDPQFKGFVDVENDRARLEFGSPSPFEEVDYFLRATYALLAFEAGGFLFHAAGIRREGRVYLFFGPSGSGKTTVAQLSPDMDVLNDDLVILLPSEAGWLVHATPFSNPTQVPAAGPICGPLEAMFQLVKSPTVFAERMPRGEALAAIVAGIPVISADPSRSAQLLERGMHIMQTVPAYELHFRRSTTFWEAVNAVGDWSERQNVGAPPAIA